MTDTYDPVKAQDEYTAETPFVNALLQWCADNNLIQDMRTAVLARALGIALYEDFHNGPLLHGAYKVIGLITLTHAQGNFPDAQHP